MKSQLYLISGIGISSFGVGRFLKHLDNLNEKAFFVVKWKRIEAIKKNKSRKKYFKLIHTIVIQIFDLIFFYIRCCSIKNKEIIIIHPQTIGWKFTLHLMKRNTVHWYLIDNSFFCIKSYNYRSNKGECIDCLGDVNNCSSECEPFPVNITKNKNLDILKKVYGLKGNMNFYCQNPSQEKLLKLHFGDSVQSQVVGMNTGEIQIRDNSSQNDTDIEQFSIVYHGSILESKGINYFLSLAQFLPDAIFYVPSSKEEVEKIVGGIVNNPNVKFEESSWESGLKELVENAFITLCPSLWSSCVEGAVLKSLKYSKNVAMVENQFGFVNDLPDEVVIKLNTNLEIASEKIKKCYSDKIIKNNEASVWLQNYLCDTDSNLMRLLNS